MGPTVGQAVPAVKKFQNAAAGYQIDARPKKRPGKLGLALSKQETGSKGWICDAMIVPVRRLDIGVVIDCGRKQNWGRRLRRGRRGN